ncbi:MAG: extracellular solute-binding protein [Patescibacteria group bacterium]
MSLTKPQIIILGSVGLVVVLLLLVFLGVLPGLQKDTDPKKIKAELNFWSALQGRDAYAGILEKLKTIYPNVTINHRDFGSVEDYEAALLDALAAGKGPDIFAVKNNATLKEANKIYPLPQEKFSIVDLRGAFPQVVEGDFALNGKIYGLPPSVDTLALIYNRDILDENAISPPQTWVDFKNAVPKLVKFDAQKNLVRAAGALGESKNIRNVVDILSLLMLQTGTEMVSENFSNASFASPEGLEAFNFFLEFRDPKRTNYTWNTSMPNSLDAFGAGTLVMTIDYFSALKEVRARDPFLNYGVAEVPQPKEAKKIITYSNYWGLTVSKQSRYANLAWDTIILMTTDRGFANLYLKKTGRPPALRTLVNNYAADPILNVFAKQILVAKSWPQIDPKKIEMVFDQMIEAVNVGGVRGRDALEKAENQVDELLSKRIF